MSITFACGHCGKTFTIEDQYAGKKGKCKQCGALMQIPNSGPSVNYVPGATDREVSSSRRTTSPIPTRREVSPSSRATAPAPEPPRSDVFGFDDDPSPRKYAVRETPEEDLEPIGSAPPARLPAGAFDPPRKKKKKKHGWDGQSPLMIVGRIAVGLAIGSVGVFLSFQLIHGVQLSVTQGLVPRQELEKIMQERVTLHQAMVDRLALVENANDARGASAVANQGMRAITRNLRKLQVTKALQTDIEAMKQKYASPQEQVILALAAQLVRVKGIPDAWEALNLDAAIEEMGAVERSIPGLQQIQVPQAPISAPSIPTPTPPQFNPPTQPGPPPGIRNRPGSRRPGIPRPGMPRPGGPPGFGGPG
jgi:hypothetical protein